LYSREELSTLYLLTKLEQITHVLLEQQQLPIHLR